MPAAPPSRSAKKASGDPIKSTHKKNHKKKSTAAPTGRAHGAATSAAGDAAAGSAAALPERNPKGVPAPAAVLMQALGIPLSLSSSSNSSGGAHETEMTPSEPPAVAAGPSPSLVGMEVEVETKQGYIYAGKLASLDAHYNVLLHESLVRRARDFDYERAARLERQQHEARLVHNSLQGSALYDADADTAASRAALRQAGLPRPRYIGTVALRSSNVVLMRFVEPAGLPAAGKVDTAWARLQKSFASMAAAIKAHLQREKMRKRAARRKRLEAKK